MDLDARRLGRYRGHLQAEGQLFHSDGSGAMHFFGMRLNTGLLLRDLQFKSPL